MYEIKIYIIKLLFILAIMQLGIAHAVPSKSSVVKLNNDFNCDLHLKLDEVRKIEQNQLNGLAEILSNIDISSVMLSTTSFNSGFTVGKINSANNFDAISESELQNCRVSPVPIPQAGWLFGVVVIGFVFFGNRRKV